MLWLQGNPFEHPLLAHLGVEPLEDAFNAQYLHQCTRQTRRAIKTVLMDARIVVGVGNIYANEALFSAGIDPRRQGKRISLSRYQKLAAAIKQILTRAIEIGGTTLKDFTDSSGNPGYFQQQLQVYGRGSEPCLGCQKPLTAMRLGQRTTVFCKHCQK
jgi:formamidopyrimidine-DNA glycosylase